MSTEVPTSLRLPQHALDRCDRLATSLSGRMPMRMSRAAALRLAVLLGMHALEQIAASPDMAAGFRVLAMAGDAAAPEPPEKPGL